MNQLKTFCTFALVLAFIHGGFSLSQIPPGYYDEAMGLTGNELRQALHGIIDDHIEYSYDQIKSILQETDEDPDNSNNVILLYTGRSQAKSTFGGGPDDWNREHVWAKSHGGFGNTPPCGTDVHHIRPTDASVNSDRGNKDFDNGGQQHPEATGCYFTEYTWEPRDEVKGDVARMILYMDVRYEGGSGEPDLTAVDAINTSPYPEHGRLSAMLEWHTSDPPDAFEMDRNNVIYSYQQNRNPFIDHPEFVEYIWNPPSATGDHTAASRIIIYPVPANDRVSISGLTDFNCRSLQLFSLTGVEVFNKNVSAHEERIILNLSGIPNGIYFCLIRGESGSWRGKITVSH